MNDKYDNTTGAGWYTPEGGYSYVQDNYKPASNDSKFAVWYNTQTSAWDSRGMPNQADWNRQYVNFTSVGAGDYPSVYSDVLNVALGDWLAALESGKDKNGRDLGGRALRSGIGVVPMDYPTQENIDHLIRANFGWTHRLGETQQGLAYLQTIIDWIKSKS